MPIMFDTASHVYVSNDGRLAVERYDMNDWVVFQPNGCDLSDIALHSAERSVCEAFILGYDLACKVFEVS